jgi:OmpA family protein
MSRLRDGGRWFRIGLGALVCALPFESARAAPNPAVAEGPYLAASLGATTTNGYGVGGAGAHIDNHDTGVGALLGFRFLGAFAVEISYVDLGSTTSDGAAFSGFNAGLGVHGFALGLAARYPPRTPLAGELRMGAFRWTQSFEFHSGDTGDAAGSESGGSFAGGVGAHWRIPGVRGLGVTAGWTRYFRVGDPNQSGQRYDRDFIAGGVTWAFGRSTRPGALR